MLGGGGKRLLDGQRGFGSFELPGIDCAHLVRSARACRLPPGCRRAERAEMDISDPPLRQRPRQRRLGKARPARGGDRPHVDQRLDASRTQLIQELGLSLPLIADGEERRDRTPQSNSSSRKLLRRLWCR